MVVARNNKSNSNSIEFPTDILRTGDSNIDKKYTANYTKVTYILNAYFSCDSSAWIYQVPQSPYS